MVTKAKIRELKELRAEVNSLLKKCPLRVGGFKRDDWPLGSLTWEAYEALRVLRWQAFGEDIGNFKGFFGNPANETLEQRFFKALEKARALVNSEGYEERIIKERDALRTSRAAEKEANIASCKSGGHRWEKSLAIDGAWYGGYYCRRCKERRESDPPVLADAAEKVYKLLRAIEAGKSADLIEHLRKQVSAKLRSAGRAELRSALEIGRRNND